MMCIIDWSALGSMISAIAAVLAVIYGYKQFIKLNNSLNDSNMMKVFEIEFELNRRKERCSEIMMNNKNHIYELKCKYQDRFTENLQFNDLLSQIEKEHIGRMKSYYDEAHDNYLNAFERLCDLILKKKMEEEDFRGYYFPTLKLLIEKHSEKFTTDSYFTNMIGVYNKWKDQN